MNEKLQAKIIEYHKKYEGNVAKIMVQLSREGYMPPSRSEIRVCLIDQENKTLHELGCGSVQKKVGVEETYRGPHSLEERA